MELLPIYQTPDENRHFLTDPRCDETLAMTMEFYKKVGFNPPWIGYYVKFDGQLVASVGFKGQPVEGKVEIAYGVLEEFQNKGLGTKACSEMVKLALKSDDSIIITARTLPHRNFSTRILEKNNFAFIGTVNDPDDGEVWEWQYIRES